jgi:pilus assembly protein Flp/PilA
MLHLMQLLAALRRDGRGVTALEYGLIAGAIALAISGAVISLGGTISGVFGNLANGAWSA